MSLSKKERLEQGFDMFPKEPVRTRFLVSDITQEAMAKSISENPRGICLYMDELQGWINNFTRYNKGSEEQFYISLFNGYMYISDRKMNTNNIMIDSPFSNVIGTIQPEILIDTFKGSKSNNGLLDRILFAIPEIQDKLYWKDDDIDIITVSDIKKSFGKFTAVHHSSFTVKRGEIFGLLGPNGAGKTTTFRMICGLLNPTSGTILINKFNLRKAKAAVREQIGYVSQKFSLYKKLTLKQNLDYFAGSYGLYGKAKEERINYLIDDFMLRPFCDVLSEDLPFGIQRQLSMACALLHNPKILFLDEATSGADPTARRVFWQRIIELSAKGTSVIVTTHFMEEAEYCDRFLIQDKGRILCLGAPDKICFEHGKRVSVEETFISKVKEYRLKTKEALNESS